ncbi:hypothetical protein C9J85_00050 [Haloferax sp. wsp5]|nr:hypothetical protein C9J85_00050 [Haloferax sp. wsp5]
MGTPRHRDEDGRRTAGVGADVDAEENGNTTSPASTPTSVFVTTMSHHPPGGSRRHRCTRSR